MEEEERKEVTKPGPDEMYCPECGAIIKRKAEICPNCGVRVKPVQVQERKSPGLAAVASAIIPGLGQIYNGDIMKGIVLMILYGVSVALIFVFIGFFLAPIVWIYAIYNAYKTAEKINAGLAAPSG